LQGRKDLGFGVGVEHILVQFGLGLHGVLGGQGLQGRLFAEGGRGLLSGEGGQLQRLFGERLNLTATL